tara:strand:+ start:79 stop:405 length:327 start_codon:yes stop_codon:yes gene_type:complete
MSKTYLRIFSQATQLVGLPAVSDDVRATLIQQAEQLSLSSSCGPGYCPDGNDNGFGIGGGINCPMCMGEKGISGTTDPWNYPINPDVQPPIFTVDNGECVMINSGGAA